MTGGVAIFVKTPGLSPLKTRLAAGIGAQAAEAWYLRAADAVAEVAASVADLKPYFAVAEALGEARAFWHARAAEIDVPASAIGMLEQGSGSLGQRMAHVHARLLERHRFALLLGADTPQVARAELAAARDWLDADEARLCLGPARDGGFWLFGSNRPIPLRAWLAPSYSTPQAAAQFQHALDGVGAWHRLCVRSDVDTAADLEAAAAELSALQAPTRAQSGLLRWMRQPLSTPPVAAD